MFSQVNGLYKQIENLKPPIMDERMLVMWLSAIETLRLTMFCCVGWSQETLVPFFVSSNYNGRTQ